MKRIISMLLLVAAVALLLSAETDKARISYYWPPKGGTNCARYVDGWCRSKTASGMPWEAGLWWIAACPPEFPFGTVMLVGWRPVAVVMIDQAATTAPPEAVGWWQRLRRKRRW